MKRSNLHEPTIIFSVSTPERSGSDNEVRSKAVGALLDEFGIKYKVVSGRYEGFIETSFVVNAKHEKLISVLTETAGQSCYLYLDDYRTAFLVNPSGRRRRIGKFVHASHKPAGDYTLDRTQYEDHYYEVI